MRTVGRSREVPDRPDVWHRPHPHTHQPHTRNHLTAAGWTPLHFACMNGHTKTAKWLVELARASPSVRDANGATPLFYAACHGHLEIVQWLVEGPGLQVDDKCYDGRTPMHVAREERQTEVSGWPSLTFKIREGAGVGLEEKPGSMRASSLLVLRLRFRPLPLP